MARVREVERTGEKLKEQKVGSTKKVLWGYMRSVVNTANVCQCGWINKNKRENLNTTEESADLRREKIRVHPIGY